MKGVKRGLRVAVMGSRGSCMVLDRAPDPGTWWVTGHRYPVHARDMVMASSWAPRSVAPPAAIAQLLEHATEVVSS